MSRVSRFLVTRLAARFPKYSRHGTSSSLRAKLLGMSVLLGLMCIFSACSTAPSAPASPNPNLVVTVAPGHADIGVNGIKVDMLSQNDTSYNSDKAMVTNYRVEPGAYYTVEIEAEGRAPFTKRYFVRDESRKIDLKVGLASKGDVSGDKYTASFEAEAADVKSNVFEVVDDESASSGSYLVQEASVSGSATPPEEASVAFSVDRDDSYTLWARMYAPSGSNDALYLGFDEQLERTTTTDYKTYAWVKAGKGQLSTGDHRISVGHAEAGARLDLLVVTNQDLSAVDLDKFVTTVEFEETQVGPSSEASAPGGIDTRKYALRGNPDFTSNSLTAEQRTWYDRLWRAINNPEQYPNATRSAKSDDVYEYRGNVQDYNNALLTAFRMTGDLRLLDEVSRVSELMRKELRDEWRDTLEGGNGKKDGYLNWVTRYSPKSNRKFIGNDTQMSYDLKANAHVSLFAWAFENNRDLKSPGGYDYAEQADFWEDYLVNHFEAKWRKRNGKATGFPFAPQRGLHTYHSFMKWHYYMGKLTGKSAYSKEAERMADVLWRNEFKEVSTKYGTGLVWPRGVLSEGSGENYLMPQGYARYVVQEAVDLHFEGFSRYADKAVLRKMANATADFVIDRSDSDSFARDIGGGSSRAGIPASSSKWKRMSQPRFAESSWSYLAAWAESDKIEKMAREAFYDVSNAKYNRKPERVFLPTGMFLKESLD